MALDFFEIIPSMGLQSALRMLARNSACILAYVAFMSFAPASVMAVSITPIDADSNIPAFISANGGRVGPDAELATIDSNTSSDPLAFVDYANQGATPSWVPIFDYTLDGHYDIFLFELWNDRGQVDTGIQDFTLQFLSDSTLLGTYTDTAPVPDCTHSALLCSNTFTVPTVLNVNRIKLIVSSSHGVQDNQFREVKFGGTLVPEPTSFLLLSMGLVGLGVHARRRGTGGAPDSKIASSMMR